MAYKPVAPLNELAMQESGDEVIVYDPRRQEAHCLNRVAATVLRYCDGKHTVDEIAAELAHEMKLPEEDESLIWQALEELTKAGLVTEPVDDPKNLGISRRTFIAAAILLPIIQTIALPFPVAAASYMVVNIPCGCRN